jgi:hypothetical protein
MRQAATTAVLTACALLLGCSDATKKNATGDGQPSVRAIERVLAADKNVRPNARSAGEVVIIMREIDTSGCPNDFRAAYLAHIHAWEMMADVEHDAVALRAASNSDAVIIESFIRGYLGDPFGTANDLWAAQTQIQRNFLAASQQIKQTYHRVEESAVLHGATSPVDHKAPIPPAEQKYRW